jgi:uncharacterized protein (DUF488 family)
MYYRRKTALALLEAFGGELDKRSFQKLLFLFTHRQAKPVYDFVPYQYGCFSFQANADLLTLTKQGTVQQSEKHWHLTQSPTPWATQLLTVDREALIALARQYKDWTPDKLIKYTYKHFPWYATRSRIAEQVLTPDEWAAVVRSRPTEDHPALFTIGYEGVSLEAYLTKLLKNNVRLLCDVRRNPLSMKYGFSKHQLETACRGLGLAYVHLPRLGIPSEDRQELKTQLHYDQLFAHYDDRLEGQNDDLEAVRMLVRTHSRVALTCFEANVCQCHRGTLAQKLTTLPEWHYPVIHI